MPELSAVVRSHGTQMDEVMRKDVNCLQSEVQTIEKDQQKEYSKIVVLCLYLKHNAQASKLQNMCDAIGHLDSSRKTEHRWQQVKSTLQG